MASRHQCRRPVWVRAACRGSMPAASRNDGESLQCGPPCMRRYARLACSMAWCASCAHPAHLITTLRKSQSIPHCRTEGQVPPTSAAYRSGFYAWPGIQMAVRPSLSEDCFWCGQGPAHEGIHAREGHYNNIYEPPSTAPGWRGAQGAAERGDDERERKEAAHVAHPEREVVNAVVLPVYCQGGGISQRGRCGLPRCAGPDLARAPRQSVACRGLLSQLQGQPPLLSRVAVPKLLRCDVYS